MPLPKQRFNAFVSNSVLIFVARFFPALASLIIILWYSRVLPVDDYARYTNFWVYTNIFYPILCFGVHVWVLTYSTSFLIHFFRNLPARHYLTYVGWLLFGSAVFAAFQLYVGSVGFVLAFLFLLTYALGLIAESFLVVFNCYKTLILANILYAVTYCAAHWHVQNAGFSITDIFWYLLGVNIIKLLICIPSIYANATSTTAQVQPHEEMSQSGMRSLWLHLTVYDIIQTISTWVDKFIVSILLSLAASAIYFNGSMNIPFLPIIISATGSAVLIQLANSQKADARTEAIQLMHQSGRVLSCIVFPVFFYLLFFSKEAINALFPLYADSMPIFVVALFMLPLRAYSFTSVFQKFHKGRIINTGAIGEIVLAVIFTYPLYQWLGLPGIALSFVLSCYVQVAYYMYQYTRLLRVGIAQLMPLGNWAIKLIVFGLLFIGTHYIATMYFTEKIVLFLGGGVMVAAVLVSLWGELKMRQSSHHVNSK